MCDSLLRSTLIAAPKLELVAVQPISKALLLSVPVAESIATVSAVAAAALSIVTVSPTSPILISKASVITVRHSVPITPRSSSSSPPGLTLFPVGSRVMSAAA